MAFQVKFPGTLVVLIFFPPSSAFLFLSLFCVSAFLLLYRNVPAPLLEQRIANPVLAVPVSHLLSPPKGKVFHSNRFGCQLSSGACATERQTLTLLAGVAEKWIEHLQVIFLAVAMGGFDIIPCSWVIQSWFCLRQILGGRIISDLCTCLDVFRLYRKISENLTLKHYITLIRVF